MATIFLTGFPGFLGSALLPRLLDREDGDVTATCLVQAKFRGRAEQRVTDLEKDHPELVGRIRLVEGDITERDLGLGADLDATAEDTTEVFHLAAVYDLAVPREVAMQVNVEGTRNVCDFAERASARHQYVSTCYVSGRTPGIFYEDDLEVPGQRFNNFYEETKHLAEAIVRERMRYGHPTTIYRPSVVSGDSRTGATQKFDGPFFVIRLVMKQPGPVSFLPVVGNPDSHTFNMVPRDFVVDAITELSGRADTVDGCYALADPRPLSIARLLDAIEAASGRRVVRVPLPTDLAKRAVARIPGAQELLELPPDAIDYLTHPTHYDPRHAQAALAGTGIEMPDHERWIANLVDFYRRHPDIGSEAMA